EPAEERAQPVGVDQQASALEARGRGLGPGLGEVRHALGPGGVRGGAEGDALEARQWRDGRIRRREPLQLQGLRRYRHRYLPAVAAGLGVTPTRGRVGCRTGPAVAAAGEGVVSGLGSGDVAAAGSGLTATAGVSGGRVGGVAPGTSWGGTTEV